VNAIPSIAFSPLVPWPALAVLGVLAVATVFFALFRRARGTSAWALAAAVIWLALANPSLMVEQREMQPDTLLVVVDQSPSQKIGNRAPQTEAALEHIRQSLAGLPDVNLRVVTGGGDALGTARSETGTRLFEAADRALADIPEARLAATVFITDGQVHDVPPPNDNRLASAPIHVLLTGQPNQSDRRVIVEQAPSYGLIDRDLELTVRVDDLGVESPTGPVPLVVRKNGEQIDSVLVPVGKSTPITFKLDRAGPAVIEVEAKPGPSELTLDNNRTAVTVNGVRDRLRVLLVSGEPHAGERAWRNLLKADPAVDLVHFTILRPPEKQDGTPVRELSLISFPVRELFEIKLEEFDLVIFDRYRRRGVMPQRYVDNIVEYVRNGGALLVAVGPTFAGPLSLANTPLGDILPAIPTGEVDTDAFRPKVTDLGKRHPVTAGLTAGPGNTPWGQWFRLVGIDQIGGSTLMTGPDDKPLLILDRFEKGRVALLLSDQIWLWARGYDGGGPQAELVRRLAHWLMREPELEENRLTANLRGNALEITRQRLEPDDTPVTVTFPDGTSTSVTLTEAADGGSQIGSVPIELAGVYHLTDGRLSTVIAAGDVRMTELRDVRATDAVLRPSAEASGGGIVWLARDGQPELRQVRAGQDYSGHAGLSGRPWIGLRTNQDYVVTGLSVSPLLPALLVFVVAIGGLMLAWRREGA
jgi:hypothetical protein